MLLRRPLTQQELQALGAADGVDLYFCGNCPNGHLVVVVAGHPMLQLVMSAKHLEDMAKKIRANDPNFREVRAEDSF